MAVKTARLTGRPLTADDAGLLMAIFGDARAAATLSADGLPAGSARVRQILDGWLEHWRRHGFGIRLFHEGGSFAGYAGLWRRELAGEPVVELVYSVVPDRWGRGLAPEMAEAVLHEGRRMGLAPFTCITLPHNRRSRRVMEKCGFVFEKEISHAGLVHVLYRLT